MDLICKTLYEPLFNFCGPLHTAFPESTPGFSRLQRCRETMDWSLIKELGPGCTKALLLACLTQDVDAFFEGGGDNPFLSFLGGKGLYDQLFETERAVYWGDNHLSNIIRQCMVLYALEPMAVKLQCIVSKLTAGARTKIDQANVISTLLADPTMMSSMLSLMDSPESMKTLMSSLRTIVDGMMTTKPSPSADPPEEESVDLAKASVSPGVFLKQEKRKKQKKKKQQGNPLSQMEDIMSAFHGMTFDDNELTEITGDLQSMDPTEFTSIATKVSGILNGVGDVQELVQSLGSGQGLGGMDFLSKLMTK